MSYSFEAKGITKSDAIAAAKSEMDKIVKRQPIHAADEAIVVETVTSIVDLLYDNPDEDVIVSVSGYLNGSGSDPSKAIKSVNLAVSAQFQSSSA